LDRRPGKKRARRRLYHVRTPGFHERIDKKLNTFWTRRPARKQPGVIIQATATLLLGTIDTTVASFWCRCRPRSHSRAARGLWACQQGGKGMASIFKRYDRQPIPEGAEITTQWKKERKKKVVRFKDPQDRTVIHPLSKDGSCMLVERRAWYIAYVDATGRRYTVKGYGDREATLQLPA
jgi:hypothetical protein